MPILLVLLAPLRGGALVFVLTLGLALVLAFVEDHSDRLLAKGMVHGDVEQVMGGPGLQTAELVDQGLTGCPRENTLRMSVSTTSGRELHRFENLWM